MAVAVGLGVFLLSRGGPAGEAPDPASSPELALEEASFPDLGFAISHPSRWDTVRRSVEEDREAVVFFDPASGSSERPRRAFDVIAERTSLADAKAGVEEVFEERFADYRLVGITDERVGGRDAFRHAFTNEGLRYDQWWIAVSSRSAFRLTFWAPEESYESAAVVNERILATFRVEG